MRKYLLPLFLCLFFFILPLNIYVLGGGLGVGVQGALYRYQVSTGYGIYFSPIVEELSYVGEIYTGKTAYSIICWFLGGLILGILTLASLLTINAPQKIVPRVYSITLGLSGILFLISAMFQYGIFFNGPAGITLPFGAFLLILLGIAILVNPLFLRESRVPIEKTDERYIDN